MAIIKGSPDDKKAVPPTPPPKASGILKSDQVIYMPSAAPPAEDPKPSTHSEGDSPKPPASPPQAHSSSHPTPQPSVPQPPPVDRAIVEKAHEEAAQIIQQAMQQRDDLLKRAKQAIEAEMEATNARCQEAFVKAQEDGFERGKQEGAKIALEEFRGIMDEARNVLSQTVHGRDELFRQSTGEIARLALKVAEKIIGHTVEMDDDVVVRTIKLALEKVKARESVTVRVHQADVEYVRMNKDIFERMIEGLKTFEVASDPKVERGGCIIETNLGNVDARISTQLTVISQAFGEVERRVDDAPPEAAAEPPAG